MAGKMLRELAKHSVTVRLQGWRGSWTPAPLKNQKIR